MSAQLSQGIARIRGRFLEQLAIHAEAIRRLRADLSAAQGRAEAVSQICAIVHKISGTAGTLGFAELGGQAARTEDLLRRHLAGDRIAPAEIAAAVDDFLEMADAVL